MKFSGPLFVGNNAKGWISKRVFQENKARQIFRKTNISYPLIRTRTCVSGGKKCFFCGKFDVLCFLGTPVYRSALLSLCNSFSYLDDCTLDFQRFHFHFLAKPFIYWTPKNLSSFRWFCQHLWHVFNLSSIACINHLFAFFKL